MGQRTPLNLLPGAKGYKAPVAASVRPNASDVIFKDFTSGLAPGGYKAGLGRSGVTQPTVVTAPRTTPRVSTKPSTAKATIASMKAPPALVAPTMATTLAGAPTVVNPAISEPQAVMNTVAIPSLAGSADLYTGSDFAKLSPEQQAAFASSGGTIGDTGNMIPGQGGQTGWDMGDVAKGVEAASGLANAYLGYKNYGLAKDQFGFTKAMANRNIANQASEYNTGIQNAGEVGMSLAGNTMDPTARAARQAQLDAQKISGAPIG